MRTAGSSSGVLCASVFALVSLACCGAPVSSVTRMADGVETEGRYISPEAYALYARGAALEARGDDSGARQAYELALDADPEGAEILARIAALDCRRARVAGDRAARAAEKGFEKALELDRASSTVLSELARCRGRLGDTDAALKAALAAARADPDSLAIQLLVVDLAEASGSVDLAREWLDALVTRSPASRAAWARLAAFARRHGDAGRALRASEALDGLQSPRSAGARERALEDALRRGDLERARAEATELRLPPGELAARAALLGAWALARAQAELVLAADPTDTDAWIALMAVEDVTRNAEGWANALRAAPAEPATPPSAAGQRLQAELLERVVGSDARRAWDAAF